MSINHTGKIGLFTDGLCHTFQEGTECKKIKLLKYRTKMTKT